MMNLRSRIIVFALALAVAAILLAGCNSGEDNGKPVSKDDFEKSLAASSRITIIEDLRNAPSVGKVSVMQCGVELAGSEGIAGKQIDIYAFEGDRCIGRNSTGLNIGDCLASAKGSTAFHVKYGAENASFYESKLLIFVNENTTSECRVGVVNAVATSVNSSQ